MTRALRPPRDARGTAHTMMPACHVHGGVYTGRCMPPVDPTQGEEVATKRPTPPLYSRAGSFCPQPISAWGRCGLEADCVSQACRCHPYGGALSRREIWKVVPIGPVRPGAGRWEQGSDSPGRFDTANQCSSPLNIPPGASARGCRLCGRRWAARNRSTNPTAPNVPGRGLKARSGVAEDLVQA